MGFDQTLESPDEIKLALQHALNGPPEFKRDEKQQYLGQLRERILLALTRDQMGEPHVYDEARRAINDQRATLMVINGNVGLHNVIKYEQLADAAEKHHTTIHDPGLKGDLGLVVVSDQAVDVKNIYLR